MIAADAYQNVLSLPCLVFVPRVSATRKPIMNVDNAIYLVGSTSFGYFRDKYDHLAIIYNKLQYGYQYENFIVWRTRK